MKKYEKVWTVMNIVMMLIMISICVFNRNIDAVCGWVIGFLGYLIHLDDESKHEELIQELKDVYKELRNEEK